MTDSSGGDLPIRPMPREHQMHLVAAVADDGVSDTISRLLDAGWMPEEDYGLFSSLRPGYTCVMTRDRRDCQEMREVLK